MKIREGTALVENIVVNGLLAGAEAEIYACPVMCKATIETLVFENTHAANVNTVKLYTQPSGGASRLFREVALDPGDSLSEEMLKLDGGGSLRGEATNVDEVTFTLSGIEESVI